MKRYAFYCLLFVIAVLQSLGQQTMGQNIVTHEDYEHNSYQEAIKKYKTAVAHHPDDGVVLFRLADSYRKLGQMHEAERWFEQAVRYSDDSRAWLYYAQALLCNRKYAQAKLAFLNFAGQATNETDSHNARLIGFACEKLEKEGPAPTGIRVQKADFNSELMDFSPVLWKENTIVFASNRPPLKGADEAQDPWTEAPFVDLWSVDVAANGKTGTPQPFAKEINSLFHEGPVAFSKTGDRVYMTRSDVKGKANRGFDDKKNTRLKIYMASLVDGKWSMGTDLSINDSKFSTCHPALSITEDTLVFSSDRPGGYGAMDLWMAVREGDNWSAPSNLGPEINTAGNEVFPTLDSQGDLYFSTDLMVGLGGLDIFRSKLGHQSWEMPENLGSPINSSLDDYGITVGTDRMHGHFSSNRSGTGDDIYSYLDMAHITIPVLVLDCETGKPLTEMNVLVEGSENRVVKVDAHGRAKISAVAGKEYSLRAYQDGYFASETCSNSSTVHVPSRGNELMPEVVLRMTRRDPCCFRLSDPDVKGNSMFRYQWVTGDGRVTPGRNIDYCYTEDGEYNAYLEIVDVDLTSNITKYATKITVTGCDNQDQRPLVVEGTIRDRELGIPLPLTEVSLVNKCTGKSISTQSDSTGHYQFVLAKGEDCDHWLMGKKDPYLPEHLALNLQAPTVQGVLHQDMELGKPGAMPATNFASNGAINPGNAFPGGMPALPNGYMYIVPVNFGAQMMPGTTPTEDMFRKPLAQDDVIELYNIYFDLAKWDIRPDAETDLEFLLQIMRKYPNMSGEIMAHTDSRNSFAYNLHLSEQRARAAVDWLIARGVAPERLSAKGFGEYQLRNRCADETFCTETEHQRNRRVEFKVTYFDGVIQSKEHESLVPRTWNAYNED